MEEDHYKVLGVKRDASQKEIQAPIAIWLASCTRT